MKKSNIALIAAAGFIVLATLVFFIFNTRWQQSEKAEVEILYSQNLDEFSTVVALEGADVHIEQASSYTIAVEKADDGSEPEKVFRLQNDTLYVDKGARVYVNCIKLNSIVSENSYWMGVHRLSASHLDITMNGGKLYYSIGNMPSDSIATQTSVVDTLNVRLTGEAFFNIQRAQVGIMNLRIAGKSNAELHTTIEKLDAMVLEDSKLWLPRQSATSELNLKKDSSVRLEIFNN